MYVSVRLFVFYYIRLFRCDLDGGQCQDLEIYSIPSKVSSSKSLSCNKFLSAIYFTWTFAPTLNRPLLVDSGTNLRYR